MMKWISGIGFTLFTVPLIIFVFASTSRGEDNSKILKHWQCKGSGNVEIEIRFKLTKSGDIYDPKLVKGFGDPYALKSASHALLNSMPLETNGSDFQKTFYTCTITGDKKQPEFKIVSAPCESKNCEAELKKIAPVEKYTKQLFLMEPMATRFQELCLNLYDFPDSVETIAEMEKIAKCINVDVKSSHDWVNIARWGKHEVDIMRNALPKDVKSTRIALAAYLQAWSLNHDSNILYELEDAWNRSFALDTMDYSKGQPLLLGNAAILTNQLRMADEQYRFALKEGDSEAKHHIEMMKGSINDDELQPVELSGDFVPERTSSAWKGLLHWLPVDTELVVFETKSSKPKPSPTVNFAGFFGEMILTNSTEEFKPKLDAEQLSINTLFKDISEAYCLHAARTFKVPVGGFIGMGSSDDINIIVLPESSKSISKNVMDSLRSRCNCRQVVEGQEVLYFEKNQWTFGLGFNGGKFVCSPVAGTILTGNSVTYLREVLSRLRTQPGGMETRALPNSLEEWKAVDTSSRGWVVRHYDKSYIPFNPTGMYDIAMLKRGYGDSLHKWPEESGEEVGFTLCYDDKKMIIHQISTNPKTLEGLSKYWISMFNYPEQNYGAQGQTPAKLSSKPPKITIDKNILTVEAEAPFPTVIGLTLCLSLGYFVAI